MCHLPVSGVPGNVLILGLMDSFRWCTVNSSPCVTSLASAIKLAGIEFYEKVVNINLFLNEQLDGIYQEYHFSCSPMIYIQVFLR